ncbi:MAG: type IX secretion system sortase PorU [bacterium]
MKSAVKKDETVRIVNAAERSLTLEFSVSNWQTESVMINGVEHTKLDFSAANLADQPGAPQIPYHVAILGIPEGARVNYQVLESDFEVIQNTRLAPYPIIEQSDGGPEMEYQLNAEIYGKALNFPSDLVQIDAPAFFRHQQIVRIQVAGLQFLPGTRQVRKYDRIVLRLDFVGGRAASNVSASVISRAEEEMYEDLLLNYSQAIRWRTHKRSVQKTSYSRKSFQNTTLYKFRIRDEGIYKIDGRFLESAINNLNLSEIDPAKIQIYNNGGKELPQSLSAPHSVGLVENAILIVDGGDGRFDRDDYILFYGRGVSGWEYDAGTQSFAHYIHHYEKENIYWLALAGEQNGLRMKAVSAGPASGSVREVYQGMTFLEEEIDNPLRSGLNFFGRQFDANSRTQSYGLDLNAQNETSTVELKVRLASKSSGNHRFTFSVNGTDLGSRQFFGSSSEQGQYLVLRVEDFNFNAPASLSSESNTLTISYTPPTSFSQVLLDWFEFFYTAPLRAREDELTFTLIPEAGQQTYRVSNFSGNDIELFDISQFERVKRIAEPRISQGSITFTTTQLPDQPKRFIALNPAKYKSIESLERSEIADIRNVEPGAEYIIITHDDFHSAALPLEGLRETLNPDNRMVTEVVRISDIYNNFSGGLMDVGAIRNYLKFAFENWTLKPSYVLLFGDGDYDPKNIIFSGDNNWIPTFQTNELLQSNSNDRLRELESRTMDSWYTYISGEDRVMDLAIGRINVQSNTEAKMAVDKIIAYETDPLYDNWRNTITMVGDDELVRGGKPNLADDVHIKQIESIAEDRNAIPGFFDVEKIYLSEFPKVISASNAGVTKPAAKEALIQQMNKGTLIVNFIGHGNSTQWAHEVVFHKSDNDRVQNHDMLIFFVAATCDWALYDNPERQSQAEELLLAENRGAIAILSSARLVFSNSNFRFNRFYYNHLFNSTGQTNRLGAAFISARSRTSNLTNDEKFHIYGDPTLRLAMPKLEAKITALQPDSILALSTIEIAGEVRQNGQFASDFNGTALINTFDSKKFVRNVPEAGSVQEYFLPGSSIYRGTVPVQNGRFTAKFIVPKDISYGGKLARVSAYFWDENKSIDGVGVKDSITVSSSSSNLVDTRGPEVRIYFQGYETFTSGDIIGENVTLVVDLVDSVSGINIAGAIGHKLTLKIDPDEETCLSELNRFQGISSIDLTDLFEFDEGSHLRGTVKLPLNFPQEVDVGGRVITCITSDGEDRHTLEVKAWDNSNNSTTASVEVVIIHEEGLVLQDIMNYPNPFTENTTFTFISNLDAEVRIKIYTVSGQLIRTLEYPFARSGFNMVEWDGRDEDGDVPANGVYLYKIIARSQGSNGTLQNEKIGRLAIVR